MGDILEPVDAGGGHTGSRRMSRIGLVYVDIHAVDNRVSTT